MRRAALLVAAAVAVLSARPARAQLHYDVGAVGGPLVRFASPDARGGGEARLAVHVALLPLVRIGAYGLVEGTAAGTVAGGGGRARIFSPWPRVRDVRPYLYAGAGAAARVDGPGGGAWFEAPLGIGVSYVFGRPWELTFEAGARVGRTTTLGLLVGIAFGG